MARDNELLALRNIALMKKYRQLASIKEHGKQKYSNDWILQELSLKHFFLRPDYIQYIIVNEPVGG